MKKSSVLRLVPDPDRTSENMNPGLSSRVANRQDRMEEALMRLLTDRSLEIAFQPIWDLKTETILGYEALARPPAEYGFSGPEELFTMAECSDQVADLDRLCFEAIVRSVKYVPENVLLFVNIAPATLEHKEFNPARLVAGITRRGFDPKRLVIEVTERAITDVPLVVQRALEFRDMGIKIALDDTGAGNAGLWMLSVLAVDYLKIDASIVNRAATDRSCRAVLAGIVAIAQETGSMLIAEGIESEEVLRYIRTHGSVAGELFGCIRGVQGFLIARPELAGTHHDAVTLRKRVAVASLI